MYVNITRVVNPTNSDIPTNNSLDAPDESSNHHCSGPEMEMKKINGSIVVDRINRSTQKLAHGAIGRRSINRCSNVSMAQSIEKAH